MKTNHGFTLIELLVALALFLAIGVSATTFSAKSVGEHAVADTENFLVGSLREARWESRLGKGADPWGVRVGGDRITLFQGASYESRNNSSDQVYEYNRNVSVSGPDEIVFSRVEGSPSVTGTFVISWRGSERRLTVNGLGVVE